MEVAQWLKGLAVLAEDASLVPSTHVVVHKWPIVSVLGESYTSGLLMHPYLDTQVYIPMHRHVYIYNKYIYI